MRISVNGETLELEAAITVAELLGRVRVAPGACAVEVNRTLVPRRQHEERRLADGDAVEIVTLVGGG
jgi:sulfur carrier protein